MKYRQAQPDSFSIESRFRPWSSNRNVLLRLPSPFRCAALLLVICTTAAWGQSFDLDTGRERLVSLDGDWRFHPGDSPTDSGSFAWAQPAFDDSAWKLLDSRK